MPCKKYSEYFIFLLFMNYYSCRYQVHPLWVWWILWILILRCKINLHQWYTDNTVQCTVTSRPKSSMACKKIASEDFSSSLHLFILQASGILNWTTDISAHNLFYTFIRCFIKPNYMSQMKCKVFKTSVQISIQIWKAARKQKKHRDQ